MKKNSARNTKSYKEVRSILLKKQIAGGAMVTALLLTILFLPDYAAAPISGVALVAYLGLRFNWGYSTIKIVHRNYRGRNRNRIWVAYFVVGSAFVIAWVIKRTLADGYGVDFHRFGRSFVSLTALLIASIIFIWGTRSGKIGKFSKR